MNSQRQSDELNRRNSAFDNSLRPVDFDQFVGQQKVRDRLMLAVEAAKARGESLEARFIAAAHEASLSAYSGSVPFKSE
jgi:Holliday junction resolvasome RuvABC ATP-dependent DNA helicase subunit